MTARDGNDAAAAQNGGAARTMPEGRRFVKGQPSANPGGRPKRLVEIEQMLDSEHRTVKNMREVFGRLRALSLGEVVEVKDNKGAVIGVELRADPRFMALYLDRTLGPVKDVEALDLHDASPEVLAYLASKEIH